jgi:hypothetical protein
LYVARFIAQIAQLRTSRGTFVGLVRAAGTAGRVCERRLLAGAAGASESM